MKSAKHKQAERRLALRKLLGWLHCSVLAASLPLAGAAHAANEQPGLAAARLVVVGDSLSAEYGLARGTGWVALLGQRLASEKRPWELINASISGDTTAGGKSRLPALLKQHNPKLVVIELGGNDALRGLPLAMSRDNLLQMAQMARAAGAKVLILGMQVPPNYGPQYTRDFSAMFTDVAKTTDSAVVPFILHGIADVADAETWFQADRIHPRAEAHPRILDNIWPVLKPLLR